MSADNDYVNYLHEKGVTWSDMPLYLQERHATLWADASLEYWLCRLVAEVGELAAAVAGDHPHCWQLEASQVAAIAMNMLVHMGEAAQEEDGDEHSSQDGE